jgi:hypothetical protein
MSYNFERGKHFYEEKKFDLAAREFAGLAIDPSVNLEYAYYYGLSRNTKRLFSTSNRS